MSQTRKLKRGTPGTDAEMTDAERKSMVDAIRAQVAAAKIVAMSNFERNWGTRDVAKVVGALRQTIPGSSSPTDAARKARAILD